MKRSFWYLLVSVAACMLSVAVGGQAAAQMTDEDYYNYVTVNELRVEIEKSNGLNFRDKWGNTPLMSVMQYGSTEHLRMLLDAGADVFVRNNVGMTAVHFAINDRSKGSEMIAELLKNESVTADLLDVVDQNGDTALHLAARGYHPERAKLLLAAGASGTIRDREGKTAGQIASESNMREMQGIAVLLDPMLDPKNKAGVSAAAEKVQTQPAEVRLRIPEYPAVADSIASGKPFALDDVSQSVIAGVASTIMQDCSIDLPLADRLELADFVKTAVVAASVGMDYSNPDVTATWASQQKALAQYAAGAVGAQQMGCIGDAPTRIAEFILETVRFNRKGQSGKAVFLDSCSARHGQTKCGCVLSQGMTIDPNLADRQYSAEMMNSVIERNPFVGMVIIMQCGLTEY